MISDPTIDTQGSVRIVHLEDSPEDQELVAEMLRTAGLRCEIMTAVDHKSFQAALADGKADLIISDYTLPGYDGMGALQLARELHQSTPFIFFSGTLGEETAVDSLKNGATDYVLKHRPGRLVAATQRALAESAERAARQQAEKELRHRDSLLRKIMEDVEDVIAVVNLEGRVLFCSPSYKRTFGGITPGIGTDWLAALHPDDRSGVRDALRDAMRHGASQRIEYRHVLADGSNRFVEAQCGVMHDEKRQPQFILWVSRDVTERKSIEERILEQAALLDEARDAICVTDLHQRILFWNKSAERLYGWHVHEALGRSANELLLQGEVALEALKTLIQQGEWHGELRQTTRARAQLIVESRWTLIRDEKGDPKSILVINTDVTERKAAEDIIRGQAALLNKASDAILVCDLNQQIAYWNEGAKRLYGWSSEKALGKNADALLFKEIPSNIAETRKAVFEHGEWVGELRHVTDGAEEVIVESRQTLVRNNAGEARSILHINTNITEKKRLEAQFLRTQRLENLGALAGGIAHDLNNILSPIMMAVEVIQADPFHESNARMLETIGEAAERGSELVKQILSFSRGANGDKVALELGKVVSDVVNLARVTFPRSITVDLRIAPRLPMIRGDVTQLHQVILNLCVNARDAMPNGGRLVIQVAPTVLESRQTSFRIAPFSGNFIELKIADAGTGMPPEVQAKIFEPFFTTKDPGKGTGLGLSTVLKIVKAHGGFLEVTSAPGKGTTFRIYLPVPDAPGALEQLADPEEAERGHGENILIVDDEAAIVEITAAILAASNYRVFSASDGAEAVAVFARHLAEIDLVITDMMMPTMGGAGLVNALREMKPGIRIIAVSGLPVEELTVHPDREEVSAFLKKPYSMTTLLSSIRTTLG